jgi:hypothetical protein
MGMDDCIVQYECDNVTCMYVNEKDKINIKNGSIHQTFKKRKQIIDA